MIPDNLDVINLKDTIPTCRKFPRFFKVGTQFHSASGRAHIYSINLAKWLHSNG